MEVRAEELRIGNYFEYCGNYYKSTGVLPLATYYQPKEDIVERLVYLTDIKPIPLTEEIINNCFDNELKLTGSIIINGIELQFKGNCLTNFYINNPMCHQKTNEIEIKYIHALQNFYFALCGQELKIEL